MLWESKARPRLYLSKKYNVSGSSAWSVTSTAISAIPEKIALDASGNIYVEGGIAASTPTSTYLMQTTKYNSAGTLLWSKTYGGGYDDAGFGIAVDASGSVYATGQSENSSSVFQPNTIKYNSAGTMIWQSLIPEVATYTWNYYMGGWGIIVDFSGSVYLEADESAPTGSPNWYYGYLSLRKYSQSCDGPMSFTFTDPTITPGTTPIRAVHINELRTDINTLRADAGTSTYTFVDPTLTAGTSLIRAADITDMRTALAGVYTACGTSTPTYTDPTLTAGTSLIRAVDITDLRSKVLAAP